MRGGEFLLDAFQQRLSQLVDGDSSRSARTMFPSFSFPIEKESVLLLINLMSSSRYTGRTISMENLVI